MVFMKELKYFLKSHYYCLSIDCSHVIGAGGHLSLLPDLWLCLSGFNKRIEYEPGTGSLALFPSMHLETCDEPITSLRATIDLETNHIGKGCDRDTYSEKSLHKLCGKSLLHWKWLLSVSNH